jgi:hypothetical protein
MLQCLKTTPLILFIKTKKYDDVSSEKCEAHLLNCFCSFHFIISPVPCTKVLCGYLNFQRTVGYFFVFSMFESWEKAVRSNTKNRRLWVIEVYALESLKKSVGSEKPENPCK